MNNEAEKKEDKMLNKKEDFDIFHKMAEELREQTEKISGMPNEGDSDGKEKKDYEWGYQGDSPDFSPSLSFNPNLNSDSLLPELSKMSKGSLSSLFDISSISDRNVGYKIHEQEETKLMAQEKPEDKAETEFESKIESRPSISNEKMLEDKRKEIRHFELPELPDLPELAEPLKSKLPPVSENIPKENYKNEIKEKLEEKPKDKPKEKYFDYITFERISSLIDNMDDILFKSESLFKSSKEDSKNAAIVVENCVKIGGEVSMDFELIKKNLFKEV